ncbi:hypothetical protein ASF53_05985 [Methylobacterium sp. Leaf123]|uniref:hypothetical protein n=1 Tax=Methylobacterium sp. Leaf123 TaxID=1736264 RepID=UPI0007002163|nr:hypothetical protein [Methylobacterium sp. Leaf123]KQQ23857.1 hypothetical protein ASF53_05985 [Methylobacterium sp. Leaf123]
MDGFFAPLFASGRIIDVILVLVALEALVLLGMRARWGRGPAPGALLSNLASGAALMLALRAALTGTAWPGVAAWLAAALAAHLTEMVIRFRRAGAAASPGCDKLAWNNRKWRTFGARPPMT